MPSLPESVYFESAVQLNKRLRNKDLKAKELSDAFCDRLHALGPRFNALAHLLRDDAESQAKDADREIARGRLRGPLQGIPCGVKDLFSIPGHPTTWGAKPFARQVLDQEAAAVTRLRKAKSVIAAKLSMIELAGGGGYRFASASLTGPCRNPWNPGHWAGGSSSGSAAAVAAGLIPFALGSETSGSIVTPCAFCGVTGLRPTYGLVSRRGAMPLSWTMDKVGPIARTVEDCGHILAVIAGGDYDDPGSARKSFRFAPQYARPLKELRVGYSPVDFDQFSEEPLRPAFRDALDFFRQFAASLVEVELPDLPYGPVTGTIISSEGSAAFSELIRSGRVDELADSRQIAGLKAGLEITAHAYLQAMRVRRLVQQAFARIFLDVDLLLAPARHSVAPRIDEPLDRSRVSPDSPPARRGLRSLIPAGNLAGLPAITMPCGFANGLPVGISLVARPFAESALLAAGMAYQSGTTWHQKRPVL
jgi:aspartyl-tRNA(Asn)/glutamyl-tRNA(Gln) amidotransferase subunit A